MGVIQVGKLYHPARRRWAEGSVLRLGIEGVELVLLYERPTQQEIAAVRGGVTEWAWVDGGGPIAVMCFRLGDNPWCDAPYTPHLEDPNVTPGVAPTEPGQHLLITVVLVDATTGIVQVIRQVTWPHEFATQVGASVRRMLGEPVDETLADRALRAFYSSVDTETLALMAGGKRCTGG